MDLDASNKVIFEHLLANARFSVKDLAQVLKVSKATIIKRLKFLEEKEYILRYDAIINWQKLPFIKKVYFVKVNGELEEFEKKIVAQNSVFSLIALSGLYNYQVWCFFKTRKQQLEFEKLLGSFSYEEVNVKELIFPRVTFFDTPLQISIPKIQDSEIRITKIDVAIMKYMAQGHGRDSFYEISKMLKIPYDSVHYHGKNLIRAGYFLAIVAQPGANKFTLQTTALVIHCLNEKSTHNLYQALQHTPHVISNSLANGNIVMIHFLSQTHVEYRETLSKILSLIPKDNIKNVLITHWDKVILNNRYPLEYFI